MVCCYSREAWVRTNEKHAVQQSAESGVGRVQMCHVVQSELGSWLAFPLQSHILPLPRYHTLYVIPVTCLCTTHITFLAPLISLN
jgi:hypothetical protein